MTRLTESQRRYIALFAEYVDIESGRILDQNFEADVKALRQKIPRFSEGKDTNKEISTWIKLRNDFLIKYGFNGAMADFLEYFIDYRDVKPSLINSGIYVVSEADRTAEGRITDSELTYFIYENDRVNRGSGEPAGELKLVIPAGVTQNQIKDFIQEHWKSFISVKQELYRDDLDQSQGRVKGSNSKLRARIKELVKSDVPYPEIATIINEEFEEKTYASTDIAQLVYLHKMKKSQK